METNGKPKVNTIKIKKIFADHWDQFARVNLQGEARGRFSCFLCAWYNMVKKL